MNEYISREEAIKELREVYEYEYPTASGDFDEYASHDVPNVLRNMPAADVQPVVHGYWEDCEIRGTLTQSCSVCGNDCGVLYPYNFCPNCGARMDGEKK